MGKIAISKILSLNANFPLAFGLVCGCFLLMFRPRTVVLHSDTVSDFPMLPSQLFRFYIFEQNWLRQSEN